MWKVIIALLILRGLKNQAPAQSSSVAQEVFASELASGNLSVVGSNSFGVTRAPDQSGRDVISGRIHKAASIGPTTVQQQQSLLSGLQRGFIPDASGGDIYAPGLGAEGGDGSGGFNSGDLGEHFI